MASPSTWFSTIAGAPTVAFGFISAVGEIVGAQQEVQLQDRPGVDGFFVWLKGLRGAPFSMVTTTDYTTKANALAGYAVGCGYVGTKMVLYRYGESLGQVVVLPSVVLQSIQPARCAINGTTIANGSNGFIMTLQWTLRGVS